MNEKFASYSTSTAFRLDLSKTQVKYLVLMDFKCQYLLSTSIATGRSLLARGLIEDKFFDSRGDENGNVYPLSASFSGPTKFHKSALTRAGKMVLGLIKESGLYDAVLSEYESEIGRCKKLP